MLYCTMVTIKIKGTMHPWSIQHTVEPLYSGHRWDQRFQPLYRGVATNQARDFISVLFQCSGDQGEWPL